MNRSIGLFGTPEPPADDQIVTCGRLSLRIRGAELRRVCFDGVEAVRSIAFVIRDHDWGTLALRTTSANLETQDDSFRYDYAAKADGAPVEVSITVTGSGDGRCRSRARRGSRATSRPTAPASSSCIPSKAWPARRRT